MDSIICILQPLSCWALSAHIPMPAAPPCDFRALGACLVYAQADGKLFGFAEFITAFALLVIVYTVADTRYHFRVATAPLPLWRLTYAAAVCIGLSTLLLDVWFLYKLPVPIFFSSLPLIQGILAGLFLLTAMTWLWYAFIKPPIFGYGNYKRFHSQLCTYVLRGSDVELPAIATELARSAASLVKYSSIVPYAKQNNRNSPPGIGEYAYEILLLLGNRKFFRYVVSSSPGTAMAFCDAMTESGRYRLPLAAFTSNITAEALSNKDSALYHEDEGYYSGLFGYVKPFTTSLYGNYELIAGVSTWNRSPLDINYREREKWDADQVEAYGRIILLTIKDYIESDRWGRLPPPLLRAFHDIRDCAQTIYLLNDIPEGQKAEEYDRFNAVVYFFAECLDLLDKQGKKHPTTLRWRDADSDRITRGDFYDELADCIFELIDYASSVKSPTFRTWTLHYSTLWSRFFSFDGGPATNIVRFKLRRRLFDLAKEYVARPNYQNARIYGYCLNVLGLAIGPRSTRRPDHALKKALLSWTKKMYLTARAKNPEVANSGLVGKLSFDAKKKALVKTYERGLHRRTPREILLLDLPKREGRPP